MSTSTGQTWEVTVTKPERAEDVQTQAGETQAGPRGRGGHACQESVTSFQSPVSCDSLAWNLSLQNTSRFRAEAWVSACVSVLRSNNARQQVLSVSLVATT